MFYDSSSVGVKGWCGKVCTAGQLIQFCKDIPEKSDIENFSKEIWSNPLYIISIPFTFRICRDNTDSPQQWAIEMGHMKSNWIWLKEKSLKNQIMWL